MEEIICSYCGAKKTPDSEIDFYESNAYGSIVCENCIMEFALEDLEPI